MPDPIKMTGQYACRIAPHDPVRVICVDGLGDHPVAYYDADGNLNGADQYGACYDTNYDLIPLQRRPKPVEGWAVVFADGQGPIFNVAREMVEEWGAMFPGSRLVRLIEDPEWRP